MLDTYRGGYKKALLDLRNLLDTEEFRGVVKSKSQMLTLEKSLLDLLLTDPATLDHMIDYGEIVCRVTPDKHCKPLNQTEYEEEESYDYQ